MKWRDSYTVIITTSHHYPRSGLACRRDAKAGWMRWFMLPKLWDYWCVIVNRFTTGVDFYPFINWVNFDPLIKTRNSYSSYSLNDYVCLSHFCIPILVCLPVKHLFYEFTMHSRIPILECLPRWHVSFGHSVIISIRDARCYPWVLKDERIHHLASWR